MSTKQPPYITPTSQQLREFKNGNWETADAMAARAGLRRGGVAWLKYTGSNPNSMKLTTLFKLAASYVLTNNEQACIIQQMQSIGGQIDAEKFLCWHTTQEPPNYVPPSVQKLRMFKEHHGMTGEVLAARCGQRKDGFAWRKFTNTNARKMPLQTLYVLASSFALKRDALARVIAKMQSIGAQIDAEKLLSYLTSTE